MIPPRIKTDFLLTGRGRSLDHHKTTELSKPIAIGVRRSSWVVWTSRPAVAGVDLRKNTQVVRGSVGHMGRIGSLAGIFCEKNWHEPLLHADPPIRQTHPRFDSACAQPQGTSVPRRRFWPGSRPSSPPSAQPSVLRASTISAHWFASGAKGATRLTRSAKPAQRARILSATSPR